MMAPHRPAKMTQGVTNSKCTIPEPTVFATAVPNKNAALKLKKAAQITAQNGVSTRVETTVAIELAASWKPLMKSKHSATRTITVTRSKVDSMRQECLTAAFCKASATSSQLSVVCSRNS